MTVILFTTLVPDTQAEELIRQDHEVYEALAISEVLALAEQFPHAGIIITPEIDQRRAQVIQQHWPTIRLHKRFSPMNVCLN